MSDASPAADAASKKPAEGVTTDAPAAEEPVEKGQTDSDTKTKSPTEEKASSDKNGTGDKAGNDKSRGHRDFKGKGERRDYKNGGTWSKKKKFNEFENLPESSDPEEIRAQVEFYFSKQNLSTDWHLFQEIGGVKNYPVSLKHLTTFSRMRRFQPYSAVVAALRESKDLIVLDDGKFSGAGNEAVQRKEPLELPEQCKKEGLNIDDVFLRLKYASNNDMDNSVYVKGFVDEGSSVDVGQIELEKFFKPFGAVMVRKRRNKEDNSWKGSVFVEFDTKESQEEFLKLDPKPKFNDRDLFIMSKKGYSEMKCKEKGITPHWERGDRNGDEERDYNGPKSFHTRGRGGRWERGGTQHGRGRSRGGRWERGGRGGRHRRGSPDYGKPAREARGEREERDTSASPNAESKRKRDASDNADNSTQEKKPKIELKVDE